MIDPTTWSAGIPVGDPLPVTTVQPIELAVPGRPVPLRLTVSFPVTGDALPVIVLSHGFGAATFLASQYGYAPLTLFWAAHGFVVVQPSHRSARMLQAAPGPEGPLAWRSRAEDLHTIADRIGEVESVVPGLAGRVDRGRLAAVGHSLGGHTVGLVSGMAAVDPADGSTVRPLDERFGARVLLAPPGSGGGLAAAARQRMPVLATTDWSRMEADALIVVGAEDRSALFSDRPDWRADAYHHAPGPKTLLTLPGAEHLLGGISGFDAAETTDEDPDRVAALRALVLAYLRSTLHPDDPAWASALAVAQAADPPLVRVETKR